MALPLSYNLRNLLVRKLSTLLTFTVVAVVVLVLAVLLSFAAGIRASLKASGWPENVLVLKPGATAESTSIIQLAEAPRLVQTPGVARNARGDLLISHEICVQTLLDRVGAPGRPANVAVRGVDEIAFAVHPELRIVEGRRFEPGALECIVGRAAQQRFQGLHVGGEVTMGRSANRAYRVVGVFESGGSAFESEILAPRTMISDSYNRRLLSSVVLRLADASLVDAAVEYINGPAVQLNARRETKYYADLASKTAEIVALTSFLTTFMALGAVFAVANTMFAAVDNRKREIAMLRTIGFSRRAILTAFVLEALLVCAIACAVGLAASVLLSRVDAFARQDFLSDTTWTVMAYQMHVTPAIAAQCAAVALLVGLLGSLFPARRAAATHVINALRRG